MKLEMRPIKMCTRLSEPATETVERENYFRMRQPVNRWSSLPIAKSNSRTNDDEMSEKIQRTELHNNLIEHKQN